MQPIPSHVSFSLLLDSESSAMPHLLSLADVQCIQQKNLQTIEECWNACIEILFANDRYHAQVSSRFHSANWWVMSFQATENDPEDREAFYAAIRDRMAQSIQGNVDEWKREFLSAQGIQLLF